MNAPAHDQHRRSICTRFEHVEPFIESYESAPLHCVQTSRGLLGAEIHGVATRRIELRDVAFDAGITLSASDPFPCFAVAIGIAGETEFLGNHLTSSNIGCVTGNNGMIARLHPGARWCNLTFDWDLIIGVAETHGYAVPRGDRSRGIPMQMHRALQTMMSNAARNLLYAELSDAELEDELALAVLRVVDPQERSGKVKGDSRQRSVHRVIEFIMAEYARPITVTALCQLCGVSERTLQYRFREATGLSVQQYLMNYRLQQARAMLIRGEYRQVGEVARACGFHHTGRFAQYYRRLFGKSPRETVAKASRQGL